MKRILSAILIFSLLLSLNIPVFAAEELEIPLEPESLIGNADYFASAENLTFESGTLTADQVEIFALKLPKNVALGETVTVHIKGSSVGDFRSWLICSDQTANKGDHATFSKMWKASENGFTPGTEFDLTYTLTASDEEPVGGKDANKLCFKAFAAHEVLEQLTLTYVGITYDESVDIAAETERLLGELKPNADEIAAALAEAEASPDDYDTVKAAYDRAAAAMETIEGSEAGTAGYADLVTARDAAEADFASLESIYKEAAKDVESVKILEELQSYIDTMDAAVETAKNAGSDVAAAEIALADAQAARDYIVKTANDCGYPDVLAAARETKTKITEIEEAIEAARVRKAEEEAAAQEAAEEEAAKKASTKRTLTAVGIAAAVVIVIVAVVVVIVKSKSR